MKRIIAVVISLLILVPVTAGAWQAPSKTAAQLLADMERKLVPVNGQLRDAFEGIGTGWNSNMEDAYLTLIQESAIRGYQIVVDTPLERCYAGYVGVLRTAYSLIADSIDSYRADDRAFRDQVQAGFYLFLTYADLERSVTDCPAATPTPAPTPVATIAPVRTPTPVATPKPTITPEPTATAGVTPLHLIDHWRGGR